LGQAFRATQQQDERVARISASSQLVESGGRIELRTFFCWVAAPALTQPTFG
jgi:hypothetical protein